MDRQYVGIDFHRRCSVIVRKNGAGEKLSSVRVANDPWVIAAAVAEAGPSPEVVIEASYGWYWIVDWLQEQGATVHSANPSGLNWGTRRVKNDERDAVDLIDILRLGRLPEAWIAPPATRELRELVRSRAKLVALRSGLKAQVHAVMAKEGVLPTVTDMFSRDGNRQLNEMQLAGAYTIRFESLRDLIEVYDREVTMLETKIRERWRGDRGYRAIQAINGIGPTMAATLVAEIAPRDQHKHLDTAPLLQECRKALAASLHRQSSCVDGPPTRDVGTRGRGESTSTTTESQNSGRSSLTCAAYSLRLTLTTPSFGHAFEGYWSPIDADTSWVPKHTFAQCRSHSPRTHHCPYASPRSVDLVMAKFLAAVLWLVPSARHSTRAHT